MRSVCPRMFVILLQSLLWTGVVESYPGGPPTTVCGTMRPEPSYHLAQPQQGAAPYSLTFSKNTYAANEQITGKLNTIISSVNYNMEVFLQKQSKISGSVIRWIQIFWTVLEGKTYLLAKLYKLDLQKNFCLP